MVTEDYQKLPDKFKCRLCDNFVYEYPNASSCESLCEYSGTKIVMCMDPDCKVFKDFCCRNRCTLEAGIEQKDLIKQIKEYMIDLGMRELSNRSWYS